MPSDSIILDLVQGTFEKKLKTSRKFRYKIEQSIDRNQRGLRFQHCAWIEYVLHQFSSFARNSVPWKSFQDRIEKIELFLSDVEVKMGHFRRRFFDVGSNIAHLRCESLPNLGAEAYKRCRYRKQQRGVHGSPDTYQHLPLISDQLDSHGSHRLACFAR